MSSTNNSFTPSTSFDSTSFTPSTSFHRTSFTPSTSFDRTSFNPGIVVQFCGGLGNKMFQFAAGYAASRRYNCPLYTKKVEDWNHHNECVNYFETIFRYMGTHLEPEIYDDVVTKMFPAGMNYIHNFIYQFMISTEAYSIDGLTVPVIFNQYFQFYPPLKMYEDDIRSIYNQGLFLTSKKVKADWSDVDFEKCAFLHIRRGDYLKYPDRHPVQPLSYYETAVSKLLAETPDLDKIFVFSDDMNWVNEEAFFKHDKMQKIDTPDEIYTLAFMSMCKAGAICANSSFSWWGAFLGAHEKRKPVYVPKNWIMQCIVAGLFPDEWVVI